jgi:hypothetical protein
LKNTITPSPAKCSSVPSWAGIRFPCDGRATGGRHPVERMRMLGVVLDGFGEPWCGRVEEPVPKEVERTLVGLRQSLAGFDHLVENRLQAA